MSSSIKATCSSVKNRREHYSSLLSELITLHSRSFVSFVEKNLQTYRSPVLLFDLDLVKSRIAHAKSLELKYNCRFLFAVKACSRLDILSLFAESGVGFDVSNSFELALVEQCLGMTGVQSLLVSATGPTADTVRQTSLPEFLINADCKDQLQILTRSKPDNMMLGLRVSTQPAAYGHPADTTRFGFTPSSAEEILRSALGQSIRCLHSHRSGPKFRTDVTSIGQTLSRLSQCTDRTIQYINLGGGSDRLTPHDLVKILEELRAEIPTTTTIVFEFGSYWFAGGGVALGSIVNKKRLANDKIAVTIDVSRDCHLRWSEPRFLFTSAIRARTIEAHLFGPTCYEADYFGIARIPADQTGEPLVQPGDLLLVRNVDIYSVNWNTSFNGVPAANVSFFCSG